MSDDDVQVVEQTEEKEQNEKNGSEKEQLREQKELKSLRPEKRKIYQIIMVACVQLEASNRTACRAVLLMHAIRKRPVAKVICNYTLAAACVLVAAKTEEAAPIRMRDLVNTFHHVLHPAHEPIESGDLHQKLRASASRMEYVVMREINFDLRKEMPHTMLSLYLDALRSWLPSDFDRHPIEEMCFAMLRDCFIAPSFVLSHSPASIAVAVIATVFMGLSLSISDWPREVCDGMSESKLRKLQEELVKEVFGVKCG